MLQIKQISSLFDETDLEHLQKWVMRNLKVLIVSQAWISQPKPRIWLKNMMEKILGLATSNLFSENFIFSFLIAGYFHRF